MLYTRMRKAVQAPTPSSTAYFLHFWLHCKVIEAFVWLVGNPISSTSLSVLHSAQVTVMSLSRFSVVSKKNINSRYSIASHQKVHIIYDWQKKCKLFSLASLFLFIRLFEQFFFVKTLHRSSKRKHRFLDAVSETSCVDVYVGTMFLAPSIVLPANSCLFCLILCHVVESVTGTPPCMTVNIWGSASFNFFVRFTRCEFG